MLDAIIGLSLPDWNSGKLFRRRRQPEMSSHARRANNASGYELRLAL